MEAIRNINNQDMVNTLDDAIDDVENGRIISEEELWKELDIICKK